MGGAPDLHLAGAFSLVAPAYLAAAALVLRVAGRHPDGGMPGFWRCAAIAAIAMAAALASGAAFERQRMLPEGPLSVYVITWLVASAVLLETPKKRALIAGLAGAVVAGIAAVAGFYFGAIITR